MSWSRESNIQSGQKVMNFFILKAGSDGYTGKPATLVSLAQNYDEAIREAKRLFTESPSVKFLVVELRSIVAPSLEPEVLELN